MGGLGSGSRFDKKNVVEDYDALDVRHLKRNGVLQPGARGSISWSRRGGEVSSIGLRAERGRVVLKYRHKKGFSDWQDVEQSVPLTWTPCNLGGHRPWFMCPGVVNGRYCGRRVAILYSAGLYFLCRHCYDLSYCSRQESQRYRALRRAQKIRRMLGGSANMMKPFPDKPKGMHLRTYIRLFLEYEQVHEAYTRAMVADVERLTSRGCFGDIGRSLVLSGVI